ncbi:MAG: hypothetical protein WAM28_05985 [Chlamydiales bacterium]
MACEITFTLFVWGPSTWVKNSNTGRRFYATCPNLARGCVSAIAVISAIANVFLFPCKAIIGFLCFPFIALFHWWQGEGESCIKHLKAWVFSLIIYSTLIILLALSTCMLPFQYTMALYSSFIALSIILHVQDACSDPLHNI